MSRVSLRIASYNVHACVGTDGIFSPGRIVQLLGSLNADFIALQEVENRIVDGMLVSEQLSNRLGMHAYPGPTLQRGDADYGNLLLARPEAAAITRHELSVLGREPRGIIEADFRLDGKLMRIFVTHLGLSGAERRKQLDMLGSIIGRGGPDLSLLAADFNEWLPASPMIRQLGRHFEVSTRQRTFPSRLPLLALDRIWVTPSSAFRSSRVVRSKLARQASDHLPLVCDFAL